MHREFNLLSLWLMCLHFFKGFWSGRTATEIPHLVERNNCADGALFLALAIFQGPLPYALLLKSDTSNLPNKEEKTPRPYAKSKQDPSWLWRTLDWVFWMIQTWLPKRLRWETPTKSHRKRKGPYEKVWASSDLSNGFNSNWAFSVHYGLHGLVWE